MFAACVNMRKMKSDVSLSDRGDLLLSCDFTDDVNILLTCLDHSGGCPAQIWDPNKSGGL